MKPFPALDFTPTLVLYHANCPDGFAAAWALHERFGAGAVYRPAVYGQAPGDDEVRNQRIIMVDVSFPREDVERLHRLAERFVLVDHHASAEAALGDLPYTYFDQERSAATLAWDWCFPGQPRPLMVEMIEDRDLWRHAVPQTRLLGALDSLPFDFKLWSSFRHALESADGLQQIQIQAAAIDRAFQSMMDRVVIHATRFIQNGLRGWVVNAPHDMASFICARLYDRPDTDFAMSWYMADTGQASCSWRSSTRSGVDVIPLAGEFGGGGHRCAAGARMSMQQLLELIGQD